MGSTEKDMKEYKGTRIYAAPEVICPETLYGKEVDWWSFGTLLYNMVTLTQAFGAECRNYRHADRCHCKTNAAINGGYGAKDVNNSAYWLDRSSCSAEAKDLIIQLLQSNPANRWNATKHVRDHPWFAGFDWALLDSGRYPAPWVPKD